MFNTSQVYNGILVKSPPHPLRVLTNCSDLQVLRGTDLLTTPLPSYDPPGQCRAHEAPLPPSSPACQKLDVFLRMSGITFTSTLGE